MMEDQDDLVDYDLDLDIDINKEEFSDLNCDSENGVEGEESLCFYCDANLPSTESIKDHLVEKHSIKKNLEFLCQVTLDKQKEDIVGVEAVSPEPLGQETKKDDLDDVSDIESADEDEKAAKEAGSKEKSSEAKKEDNTENIGKEMENEKQDSTETVQFGKPVKEENEGKVDANLVAEKFDDDGKESKRDWMYGAKNSPGLSKDDEGQSTSDKNAGSQEMCKKCDVLHPIKGRCHFNLKFSKSSYVPPAGKDNAKKSRKPPPSRNGKRSALSPSRLAAAPSRKHRVAPPDPRVEVRSSANKKVRTLPSSLYNNPDALSNRMESRSPDDRRSEDRHSDRRRGRDFVARSRSRSPDSLVYRRRSPEPSSYRYKSGSREKSPHHYSDSRVRSYRGSSPDDHLYRHRSPPREMLVIPSCDLCNSKNHRSLDCHQLFCILCNKQGHFAKNCPRPHSSDDRNAQSLISPFSIPPPSHPPVSSSLQSSQASWNSSSFQSGDMNFTAYGDSIPIGASAPRLNSIPQSSYTSGYTGFHGQTLSGYGDSAYQQTREREVNAPPLTNSSVNPIRSAAEPSALSIAKNRDNALAELAHLQFFIASKVSEIEGNSTTYGNSVGATATKILAQNDFGLSMMMNMMETRGSEYVAMQIRNIFKKNITIQDFKMGSMYENLITNLVLQYLNTGSFI